MNTEKFWNTIARKGPDDCWLWQASLCKGYGQVWHGGGGGRATGARKWYAHRLAYTLVTGPIPPGCEVMHTCDTPRCCNPAHLRAGTHAENVRDMDGKGRRVNAAPKGAQHGRASLTEAQVHAIREEPDSATQVSLAAKYGVAQGTISRLLSGESYRSVKPPCR